jgi:hypothetical protein
MKFSFINPGPNEELSYDEKQKMIGACLHFYMRAFLEYTL